MWLYILCVCLCVFLCILIAASVGENIDLCLNTALAVGCNVEHISARDVIMLRGERVLELIWQMFKVRVLFSMTFMLSLCCAVIGSVALVLLKLYSQWQALSTITAERLLPYLPRGTIFASFALFFFAVCTVLIALYVYVCMCVCVYVYVYVYVCVYRVV